jgi:hypothetical protein
VGGGVPGGGFLAFLAGWPSGEPGIGLIGGKPGFTDGLRHKILQKTARLASGHVCKEGFLRITITPEQTETRAWLWEVTDGIQKKINRVPVLRERALRRAGDVLDVPAAWKGNRTYELRFRCPLAPRSDAIKARRAASVRF